MVEGRRNRPEDFESRLFIPKSLSKVLFTGKQRIALFDYIIPFLKPEGILSQVDNFALANIINTKYNTKCSVDDCSKLLKSNDPYLRSRGIHLDDRNRFILKRAKVGAPPTIPTEESRRAHSGANITDAVASIKAKRGPVGKDPYIPKVWVKPGRKK